MPKKYQKINIAEVAVISPEDITVREAEAVRLILTGIKKQDAIKQSELPHKQGDRNYKRVTKKAGKTQIGEHIS